MGNGANSGKTANSLAPPLHESPIFTLESVQPQCTDVLLRENRAPTRLAVRRSHTMRERPAGTTVGLSGMMLAGLLLAVGCNSTSSLPGALTRAPATDPSSTDIAWKKATPVHSAAVPQDQWSNPNKADEPIQRAAFQAQTAPPPLAEMPAIPDLMMKDGPPGPLPGTVIAQPGLSRHGGVLHGPALPMALPGAPTEYNLVTLPTYTVRPPDVLLIESQKGLLTQPVRGQHLVRVDGTVGLGIYGPAAVSGKTIQQAREEIARVIHSKLDAKKVELKDVLDGLSVDVLAYNSSVYYIITDGAGLGEQVYRFPVTGNETVLDAIANINGLPVVAAPKKIWVARRNTGPGDNILPVDWKGITQLGAMNTNWQIMPGDRLYVQADSMRRFNNNFSKFVEPIERLFGVTLLGANAVNTIKSGTPSTGR
jgi:polysaccharide biosynthesis/export protein